MEHPFFPSTTTRAEALRWLAMAEKLLSTRDLLGSKSFASRARNSDPTLTPADQILAIVDTLLVSDSRIGNDQQQDWYAILRLTPQQGRDFELIAAQYRNLALILNPQRNKFPFAEQALRLVVDAWSVLSDPLRKSVYDKELSFYLQPQQQPDPFQNPIPTLPQNFMFFGASSPGNVAQPQVHAGGTNSSGTSHFSQVQLAPEQRPVDPVSVGPIPIHEQQNFMSFASGSNIGFGSAAKLGSEPLYKQAQSSYTGISSNVAFAPWSAPELATNKQKQKQPVQDKPTEPVQDKPFEPVQDQSDVSDKSKNNANAGESVEVAVNEEEVERVSVREEIMKDSCFWTTCPYCFYVYEYSRVYVDCSMRCQNCRRAFQAVEIPSPPPTVDGQDAYFCCWAFLPLGVSKENWEKNKATASTWTPFSPMFSAPQTSKGRGRKVPAPRIYHDDDDDVFIDISEPSDSDDDDWRSDRIKKKKGNIRRRRASGTSHISATLRSATLRSARNSLVDKGKNVDVEDGIASPNGLERPSTTTGEPSKKGAATHARKQPGRGAKNFGKLDLNVEFSNEADEPAPKVNPGAVAGRGEEDNIEGTGFFEGLDEFLNSLPILNGVGDDKVVKAA